MNSLWKIFGSTIVRQNKQGGRVRKKYLFLGVRRTVFLDRFVRLPGFVRA